MSGGKKNVESLNFEKVTAILLDVAGTTTAINFVKDTLFPYVIKSVEEFLKNAWEDEEVKKAVSLFEEKDLDISKATEIVKILTEKNDGNIGLKTIQGLVLKKGYESGELKGHVFVDVPKCLEVWSKNKRIAIFSTGSVDSQQLLFKNTVEGDLTSHITKYFDQSVGVKSEEATYKKIAEELDVIPENILFLTDDIKEAEAAKSANFISVLVEREGNSPIPEDMFSTFFVIKSFTDIPFESVKRKIEEDSVEQPPTKIAKTENVEIIEKELSKNDQNVERETVVEEKKVEQVNDEAMEVDSNGKSEVTEKTEDCKADKEVNSVEKSEEPTSERKSSIEDSAVKECILTNEEKQSSDCKTELTLAAVETSPSIEKKPTTEENLINEESENQEKQIAPVGESEAMEVEATLECDVKITKEQSEQCIETDKLESNCSMETKETTGQEILSDKTSVPEATKELKNETEIGTQTKTVTNECETQTTISIKVAEELPTKEVQAKLMATPEENENIKDTEVTEAEIIENKTDKTNKIEANGDKIEEDREKKVDEVCDSGDTKKDVVIDTNGTEEQNGIVECKLEKTKADTLLQEAKVSVADEASKENKDKNTLTEVDEIKQTNGDTPKENGVHDVKSIKAAEVIEEKENKSDLANSMDNGVSNREATISAVDSVPTKEEEIKVKTIEDKVESKPVSVEA